MQNISYCFIIHILNIYSILYTIKVSNRVFKVNVQVIFWVHIYLHLSVLQEITRNNLLIQPQPKLGEDHIFLAIVCDNEAWIPCYTVCFVPCLLEIRPIEKEYKNVESLQQQWPQQRCAVNKFWSEKPTWAFGIMWAEYNMNKNSFNPRLLTATLLKLFIEKIEYKTNLVQWNHIS